MRQFKKKLPLQNHGDYQLINSASCSEDTVQPTIALLNSYDLIDDFLESLNISFESFCSEFIGSWIFGYVNALKEVGVRTVLFFFSMHVSQPSRFLHQPTNTTICVLPPSNFYRNYRSIRRRSLKFYGGSEEKSFKDIQDNNHLRRSLLIPIKNIAKSMGSYLCMPLILLTQELRRENCQVLLCQEYESARFDVCVLLEKLIGIPTFTVFQGGNRTQSGLEVFPRQLALRFCTGIVVATRTEIDRIQSQYGVPSSKITRIFNPVDTAIWQASDQSQARGALSIPLDAKVVVWHGRVEMERKGLDVLLAAWQEICNKRPNKDLRLLLIGTGSDASRFSKSINEMQLKGVQWVNDFVSDRAVIQQYLSAADVYTLPSRQEGFPVAPIEAMSCGLPVVAADAPGVPDILEGGEVSGGIVVPRGDASALASALGRILDDKTWGRQLGKNARDRAENYFSPSVIGQQLNDVFFDKKYNNLIKN